METLFYVDGDGAYLGGFSGAMPPDGAFQVSSAPGDASQTWNFKTSSWDPIPGFTEQEMKEEEIRQDKQFLADTDWIVAKMGEASFTGQDVTPMIEQYATQLADRENARVRIRINEGRA